MEERYVAFDVETPNAQNRRMSAIGVSVIERGEIVQMELPFVYFGRSVGRPAPEMMRSAPFSMQQRTYSS